MATPQNSPNRLQELDVSTTPPSFAGAPALQVAHLTRSDRLIVIAHRRALEPLARARLETVFLH